MKARSIAKNLLLAFVLISLGYAAGREVTLRSLPAAPSPAGDRVIVYYVHGTIRCVTCNKIEKMTRQVVDRDYAREVQAGRLEWRIADFQQDEALAKRYEIATSTVVVARLKEGKEVAFERLDDVWKLVDDPDGFAAYIRGRIAATLKDLP